MASLDFPRRMTLTGTAHRRPGLFARIAATLRDWQEERMTREALSRLSDRELDDIGLTRFDIDCVSRGTLLR